MKLEIITALGTFVSDSIPDVSIENIRTEYVNKAVSGGLNFMEIIRNGERVVISGDLLKNSIIIIKE